MQQDKRIDASVYPLQVSGFNEAILESYKTLMDNYSYTDGVVNRNVLQNPSQGLAAPGYFNNGVADITAKIAE